MRITTIHILLFSLFIISCKEKHKPKVKYEKRQSTTGVKKDTSTVQVADLPIQLNGSDVLIYPLGNLLISDLQKGAVDSNTYDESSSFKISNALDNEITGFIHNLKFQKIGTDSLHVLTDKNIAIERITFIKAKKVMLYVMADADTNQDNDVDKDDIKTLQISTTLGQKLTKLTPEMQELIDWNYLDSTHELYFRTIEDANKNGAFAKKDKVHYFKLDLNKEWTPVEIFPLN